jgi:hypothetical protein
MTHLIEMPVVSALDTVAFTPPGCPRTYHLSPLSYRERARLQRMIREVAGEPPDRSLMLGVLRECLTELAPANLDEAIATVDAAEAGPDDRPAQARLAVLERAVQSVPAYADLLNAQRRYAEERPLVAVRLALRGWAGTGLPPFHRDADGTVPEALLEALPAAEFDAIAQQAMLLIWLGPSAVGNSVAPSPSPNPPNPTPEA